MMFDLGGIAFFFRKFLLTLQHKCENGNKTIKDIIVDKLGVEESEVTETASFTNDLGADSLDTVELLMEFEKVFGIKIPDEETSGIATVGDAIAKVTEKLGE